MMSLSRREEEKKEEKEEEKEGISNVPTPDIYTRLF
jgi:hypothetical protein